MSAEIELTAPLALIHERFQKSYGYRLDLGTIKGSCGGIGRDFATNWRPRTKGKSVENETIRCGGTKIDQMKVLEKFRAFLLTVISVPKTL